MSVSTVEPTAPVNWWKLPWLLLWLLPALSVLAGLTTVVIAVRHGDSMVKDDYYRQGLAYNAQQQADRAAADLHLQAVLVTVDGQLLLSVSAEQLPPLPTQLQLLLSHPTDGHADRTVQLQQQGAQQFVATAALPAGVNWYVQLQPVNGSWRLRGRWQPPAPTRLQPDVL